MDSKSYLLVVKQKVVFRMQLFSFSVGCLSVCCFREKSVDVRVCFTTQMFYVFYLGLLRALIAKFSLRKQTCLGQCLYDLVILLVKSIVQGYSRFRTHQEFLSVGFLIQCLYNVGFRLSLVFVRTHLLLTVLALRWFFQCFRLYSLS